LDSYAEENSGIRVAVIDNRRISSSERPCIGELVADDGEEEVGLYEKRRLMADMGFTVESLIDSSEGGFLTNFRA
jgi:hypothetical protein